MIKFFLGVVIVCITTLVGYLFTAKYRKRKEFFVQLNEFNDRFIAEVSYYKRPLTEFIGSFVYRGEFQELLIEVLEMKKSAEIKRLELSRFPFLSQDERVLLEEYFLTMGKGDSLSQKNYFGGAKNELCDLRRKSEEECKRYGDLALKLGLLCGLAILVLIV